MGFLGDLGKMVGSPLKLCSSLRRAAGGAKRGAAEFYGCLAFCDRPRHTQY